MITYALWFFLPGIVVRWSALRRIPRKLRPHAFASIATLLLLSWSLLSCGGVSTGGSGGTTGSTPVTYVVTVTGTSGALSHSTAVSLVVE